MKQQELKQEEGEVCALTYEAEKQGSRCGGAGQASRSVLITVNVMLMQHLESMGQFIKGSSRQWGCILKSQEYSGNMSLSRKNPEAVRKFSF